MLKSFLPVCRLFESTLHKNLTTLSGSYFFATTPAPKKGQAPSPAAPKSDEIKSKFIMPPPREAMDEGDTQDPMTIPTNLYLDFIGQSLKTGKHSAYVAVERRGKVYHLYDAERMALGRMCQSIARHIQGKHNPLYRHDRVGFGDTCVVVNADKLKLTGKKAFQKSIKYHTGYVGHLREIPFKRLILEKPEQLIFRTIYKCLPKNKLREDYLKSVQVFRGPTHPLTQFLPNFGNVQESNEYIADRMREAMKPENSVVVYESLPGTAPEFEGFKREIDVGFEDLLSERSERYKPTPENKQIYKEYQKYIRKLKKFREYKVKPPKVRNLEEDFAKGTVFIDRDWKYKKLGIEKYEANDIPDDD